MPATCIVQLPDSTRLVLSRPFDAYSAQAVKDIKEEYGVKLSQDLFGVFDEEEVADHIFDVSANRLYAFLAFGGYGEYAGFTVFPQEG